MNADLFYYLLPDVAVIYKINGHILLKNDFQSITLEGEAGILFSETILPLLDGKTNFFSFTADLPQHVSHALQASIEHLSISGFIKKSSLPIDQQADYSIPANLVNVFHQLQVNITDTISALEKVRICLFGLEGHGELLLHLLCISGIRNITICDPFPVNKENIKLAPFQTKGAYGQSRQDVFASHYKQHYTGIKFNTGPEQLDKQSIIKATQEHDILISCFDKGFLALNYWMNEAVVDANKIAVYSEINGFVCRVGPTYIPEITPCYMCYKLRNKANADNFDNSMLYEQFLTDKKCPEFNIRSILPSSYFLAASILSTEIIKIVTQFITPTLAGKIIDYNLMTQDSYSNRFLFSPECPVCQKKKSVKRKHLSLNEILLNDVKSGSLLTNQENLVSSETGIVNRLEYLYKDASEPFLPHIFRVKLANFNFGDDTNKQALYCSGKGMTIEQAEVSSLGEAAERYAAARHTPDDIVYANFFQESKYEKLDPNNLVLYHISQYKTISFAPYSHENTIGWSLAYSLTKDKPVYVPSLSVFMDYNPAYDNDYFFQGTSNGLAGGATLTDAIVSAAFEVIERDAFVIMWHAKLPCRKINVLSHPDKDIIELYNSYIRRDVVLHLFQLPTDTPCTVMMAAGLEQGDIAPKVVIGLGADLDPAVAARQALLEVSQVRPALKQKCRQEEVKKRMAELVADPQKVEKLEDHDLLYADPDMVFAFDFLIKQKQEDINWQLNKSLSPQNKLDVLVKHFKETDKELIYFNLTVPELEAMGLYTARVIIPHFQPIHFGAKNIRLGGDRLFELPSKLGLKKDPLTYKNIDLLPHPLA